MSVGGKIIEIREVRHGVSALWVLDDHPSGHTETCVHVETELEMPALGENVWWQGGKVMWDKDRRELRKVGFSHNPQDCAARKGGPDEA